MSNLKGVDLQEQPAGPIVLPSSSGKLYVDEELKLSHENFKQKIDDFFKDKIVTRLSQLKTTPAFPTPHLLAHFASKAYTDYKKGETDAQYETRLALPDGWKLLTTASNSNMTNGYFGAAYWHPEHQQVVIAHRGTANLGALWTDLKGLELNHHDLRMNSASTFANKVVEVLREVNRIKGFSFQLFFTGYSLGGWLAQITTFTTEYLRREGKVFLKSNDEQDSCHPHTEVFDSQGCKTMLSKMKDTFDVRHDGRSISLKHLDITTYLSAPNPINTCHKHLGTVYQIFPDLSDMDWWRKNSPLWNLATNLLDKIVQIFDPETGQVHKDEQGQPKIQVVVFWPVSPAFHPDKKYKDFFKRAAHLTNHNSGVTEKTLSPKGDQPLRYETKTYDERVNRLSVFSEEECQFLKSYRCLRQWPEFFKPKELFCVMEDSQAQEDAEKILQNFETERDKIHCTDASALQALIPYVKRLLQLFPGIKENTKRALSSDEVRNRVYLFETRSYVERISQSPLEFHSKTSTFREFLESEQQRVLHLRMIKGDEWTGLIKVYQVLQKTGFLSEVQYTVLKLKRLLKVNQLKNLSKLMLSTGTPHLLLMACEENRPLDEETKDVIRTLFDTVKKKSNIKIIFITLSRGSIVVFLNNFSRRISRNGFVKRTEELTWSDLTASSQEKLLEKSVRFQGTKIPLNELMFAESLAAKSLPLAALLEEKELQIADKVPISKGYNESYYIGRTLRCQKAIKQEIYDDTNIKSKHVFLASTEQEFKQLCQLYPKSSVHWLEEENLGKLLWQQSQGSLETVRKYIDTERSHTYTADDLDKLLEQAQHQRVMLISDTAGMGKSTVLTHLSKRIKEKFPANWVVRIDLNDHTDALKALKKEQIDKEKAIEFVSQKLLRLKPGLEVELFKQCCEQKQKIRTVIMLDGFDQISPFYKQAVIYLLQALKQTAVEQLWVTTRPHLREELEDDLQQLSYTLEPFPEKGQVEFLTKFWSLQDWFTEAEEKGKEIEKKNLEVYAEQLIKRFAESVSDKDREFAGIPLQTRMLAEEFDEEIKIFYESTESTPNITFKLDLLKIELLQLYGRFIERKYDIYQEENLQVPVSKVVAIQQREREIRQMTKDYQLLALKVLFTEEQVTLFQNNTETFFSTEDLTRFGIVHVSHDGKPHFIHRTFAEYYVADCLVNCLTEGNNTSQQVQTFILKDVFQKEVYRVVRVFIDGLMSRSEPSRQVLKEYGNQIHGLLSRSKPSRQALKEYRNQIHGLCEDSQQDDDDDYDFDVEDEDDNDYNVYDNSSRIYPDDDENFNPYEDFSEDRACDEEEEEDDDDDDDDGLYDIQGDCLLLLHRAVREGNDNIIGFLLDSAQAAEDPDTVNTLLLAQDEEGCTAWDQAVFSHNIQVSEKLWECAEKKLTKEEVNKLLLATDNGGRNVFHLAADFYKLELLEEIVNWVKENLTRKDVKKLLLAKDNDGRTVFNVVAAFPELEVFQEILNWAKENLTTEEGKNLLLATDSKRRTVFHMARKFDKLELFQGILNWAKGTLTREDVKQILLARDSKGRTVFHVAQKFDKLEVFQGILNWAKENLTREDVKKILLATDSKGRTVFHVARKCYKLEVFQEILNWAKKTLTREDLKKLLLTTDSKRRTVFHVIRSFYKLEVFQGILNWAKENPTTEEVNKLLLATR